MDNDTLVEFVKKESFYVKHYSPAYDRVLEAMRKVDRKNFSSTDSLLKVAVDLDEFRDMYEAYISLTAKTDDNNSKELSAMIKSIDNVANSALYCTVQIRDLAYNNRALPIGYNQTCSQPSIVAFMTYLLELEEGMKVLEVGSGCGYSAAITSHLIGDSGYLVTVETIPQLAMLVQRNLEAHFGKECLEKRLKVVAGDGSIGYEKEAPYDRIYLTAGVNLQSFNPEILAKQLNPKDGILLFPEEKGDLIKQRYLLGKPLGEPEKYGPVGFVALQGENS